MSAAGHRGLRGSIFIVLLRVAVLILALAAFVVASRASPSAAPQAFTEYAVPDGSAAGITAADGFLWFTDEGNGMIGRIIPSGVLAGTVHEFEVPSGFADGAITARPDGNLWFTEIDSNQIGRIDLSGKVTEFPIPTENSRPTAIAAGPDGNLWFVESDAFQIGRITPHGGITEFPVVTEDDATPIEITSGPDGNVWFTEQGDGVSRIGRIHPQDGRIEEFPLLTEDSGAQGITAGPDGNLWFTETYVNQIGRISPRGSVVEFPIPTFDSGPQYITVGPDGNLWFTEGNVGQIGRITPAGVISEFRLPIGDFALESTVLNIVAGPDGNLWVAEAGRLGVFAPQLAIPIQVMSPTPSPTVTPTLPPSPTPTATPFIVPIQCLGDCNRDGAVTVDELLTMVNISLGDISVAVCRSGDGNADGAIVINEIVTAVTKALSGCPVAPGGCGDAVIEAGEDCDDGGICIGGTNAGTPCIEEAQCHGDGVCLEGVKAQTVCGGDADCPGSRCAHCVPQGGDRCAANCTTETDVPFRLAPGVLAAGQLAANTSGAFVHDGILQLPLPLQGAETLTIGKERDGRIPVVVKAASVQFPSISVGTLACACVRGVVARTCGGTLFEADGVTLSTNCTPGFTAGDGACAGQKPCTFVSGPENAAAGTIGCDGLDAINVSVTQQAGGLLPPPAPTPPTGSGPALITLTGTGDPGAALIFNTTAIGTVTERCTREATAFGPDGKFCTDDDPQAYRGSVRTLPSVTGTATGEVFNTLSSTQADRNIGPFSVDGHPFDCGLLTSAPPSASGASLVVVFTALNQPVLGDIVVTTQLAAQ